MVHYTDLKDHSLDAEKMAKIEFANDVLLGLSKKEKTLPSKYFYDDKGSKLFEQIMELPEYYLTNAETDVFNKNKKNIAKFFKNTNFNLIELGPGNGVKTSILIQEFLKQKLNFEYIPIDISEGAIKTLTNSFSKKFPKLKMKGIIGEYFEALKWLSERNGKKNVILFLGSNIGNFNYSQSRTFLHTLWNSMDSGDCLLTGFDLKKDIKIMTKAYNDKKGITSKFNLNLLERINKELGANFKLKNFKHYENYGVYSGAMHSYLVSLKDQDIFIKEIGKSFHFNAWEPIHTEYSYKYLQSDVDSLAKDIGFEVCGNFYDSKKYFLDTLWKVNKKKPKRR